LAGAEDTCDSWGGSDRRKQAGFSRKPMEQLTNLLAAEKKRLADSSEKRTEVIVIDARV
jgi:hypothetical protein